VKNRAQIGSCGSGTKVFRAFIGSHLGFVNYDKEGYVIVHFLRHRKEVLTGIQVVERGDDEVEHIISVSTAETLNENGKNIKSSSNQAWWHDLKENPSPSSYPHVRAGWKIVHKPFEDEDARA